MNRVFIIVGLLILATSNLVCQNREKFHAVTIDSGYISLKEAKLYYETAGEGENIVLLHDGVVHREIWEGQFLNLAKNYKVTRYDRRGYGKSSTPYSQFSNVEDLNQLFINLKIENAIIFGISAGGGIVIDFTLKYPQKVKTLILVGAVVSGYGYSSHMLTRGGRVNSISDLFADPQKFIKYIGWDDPYTIYKGNITAKKRCLQLLKDNPQNVNSDKYTFSKPPDRPAAKFLDEIKVPTLVLVGEHDIPDVQAHAGVIENGIPNAKREIISDSGHLIPLEKVEVFNSIVKKFLNRLEYFNTINSQINRSK